MRSHMVAGKFAIDICTAQGMATQDVTTTDNWPSNSHGMHERRKLCAASGSLLLTATAAAVAPAPTFTVSLPALATACLAMFDRTAYFPRGPPIHA